MLRRQEPTKRRLQRREPAPRKRAFERQEDRIAEALPGGKKTPGSGCGWAPSKKGDATGDIWRAEGKQRVKPGAASISIKRADLDKIDFEALKMHQVSVFVFGFDSDDYDRASFRLADAKAMMAIVTAVRRGEYDEAARLAENLV